MGIEDSRFAKQMDRTKWPELKDELSRIFKTKTRDEWSTIFKDSDACAFPVLDMNEAPEYEHNKVRGSFIEVDGVVQPAPAPRFSRTAPAVKCGPPVAGAHSEEILSSWGFDEAEIKDLKENHVIG
jgi:alpha-methylacyl-CoA racemase